MAKQPEISTLEDYNQNFLDALKMLNSAQREAVEQIEGPMLVIAGPGTGKTHVLAARIGQILLQTDTQPQNILCLTFTDAGVHAMRQRLLSFIGPEAHRVHIYTFHSFCNSIIQENLERFGRHDMEPISDLEQIELFRLLIDELEYNHPIKGQRNDPYAFERQLRDLILKMKSENWSVDFILEKIKEYIKSLPERPGFIYKVNTKDAKKGDVKQWKIEVEQQKMDRLRAAALLYPRYIQLMRKAKRYDYADMIQWVLKMFEEDEYLLRTYQERYLYFLVDEYQDTNGSQNTILQQLISYWENPNVFIVGDDDQSIFEFQGARLQNLLDFYNAQTELQLVVLKENYRSNQWILDQAKNLIDANTNRVINKLPKLDKNLRSKSKSQAVQPEVVSYPNRVHEAVDIVRQIELLQREGSDLSEIAVIYAQHRQVELVLNLLDKKQIPYNTRRAVNILDLPEIQKLIQLLHYINKEKEQPFSAEPDLFQLLHFDFLSLSLKDLGVLSLYMAKHRYQDKLYWRSVIGDKGLLEKIGLEQIEKIYQFSQLLNSWIRGVSNLSILQLIELVINQSGMLSMLIKHIDKAWYLQALNTFFDFVKKEADKNPRLSLTQLLDIFKSMDANYLSIGIQKTIVSDQGVNLVTAHSSKGLEFDHVFVIDICKDFWERNRRSGNQFSYPDTLTFSGEEDALEARRRLLYVAMTRAKSRLQLSYSLKKLDSKPIEHASFIDELIQKGIHEKAISLDDALITEAQYLRLESNDIIQIPAKEKAIVDSLLEGYTMSISSLNRYLRCPLSFYYEDVLKIPSLQSEAASFGIAMHDALRRLFDKMRLSAKKQFPGLKEFLGFFEEEMYKLEAYFGAKEFERRIKLGKNHLSNYYKQNIEKWNRQVFTEYNIRNVEVEGVPLIGTIDRVDLLKNNLAHIVDYKTGNTSSQKLKKPSEKDPLGGIYWRQLVFYKILFESHQAVRKVNDAEISYLEPDKDRHYIRRSMDLLPEDVSKVKSMIRDTYTKIQKHDFYQGCGESSCVWCQFVNLNQSTLSFSDPEAEALDD